MPMTGLPLLIVLMVWIVTAEGQIQQPAINSSIFPNHIARSNLKAFGRRLLAASAPTCSQTTDEYKYPWWRVQLTDEALVTKVVIFPLSEDSTSPLRNLVVSVGNVDINATSPDEVFKHNVVCDELVSVPQSSKIDIDCNSTAVGRFVSLQITQPCNFEGCLQQEERSLILCEVQVYGVNLYQLKSEKQGWILKENFDVHQSSTVFGGTADLALNSGGGKYLMSQSIRKMCFDYSANQKTGFYHANSGDEHNVGRIELKIKEQIPVDAAVVFDRLGYPFRIHFYSTSGRNLDKLSPCGHHEGKLQPGSTVVLDCSSPIVGRKFLITVQNTTVNPYKDTNDILEGCDIKLWGNRAVNLAQHKPTAVSSTTEVEEEAFFGVDGSLSGFAVDKEIYVRTNASDVYPWWKVDLLSSHLVKEILIFTRKTDILQDVVIRVGNTDVPENFGSTIFEGNRVCQDLNNHTLDDLPIRIRCSTPILGRYVTIQLMRDCNDSTCNEEIYDNILTFTEVEVYGIPVDIYYFGNLALEEEAFRKGHGKALPADSVQKIPTEGQFCWWVLSSKEAFVIQEIDVYLSEVIDKDAKFSIQIWVEDDDMTQPMQNEWLKPNDSTICYRNESFVFAKSFQPFWCNHLIGRYVYVQYTLAEISKTNKTCQDIFSYDVSVWGYRIKKNKDVMVSQGEAGQWREDPHSITVDPWDLVKLHRMSTVRCTYTAPGLHPYPWWQIKFNGIYKISRVLIANTNDKFASRLHDVEIRIGFEDITDHPLSLPFTQNPLCHDTGSISMAKDVTFIDCDEPLIGNYLTIQITKPCRDPKACNVLEPNILHLCGVSPYGGEVTDLNPTDVNLAEGGCAVQSTTSLKAEASLAVDGNT